ncbi:hypothetical protein EDC44_1311, partial [Cricetibacter osteomyelitidis]
DSLSFVLSYCDAFILLYRFGSIITDMNRFIMLHLLRAVVADLSGFVVINHVVLVAFSVDKDFFFILFVFKPEFVKAVAFMGLVI